ncbi:MAG: sugar phosphate isomerase/epimerase [Peptococcaceae bacterium]|nr:sugar phosphate isomerase/epimerase [Peptococcaceae bacterium]
MLRFAFSDLVLFGHEPGHNIRELYWAKASGVEILMDGPAWRNPRQTAASVKAALADCPVELSLHPPSVKVNLADADEGIRHASWRAHLDALELARELGARHLVVHPGFLSPGFPLYRARQLASEAVAGLQAAARGTGVLLGLENVGHGGTSLFNEDEYITFGEQFDAAGYLVDTGHANLNGWNLASLLKQTRTRLAGVHLHDNRGDTDLHLPVGEGKIHWPDIWPLLPSLDCPLILEYAPGTPLATLVASCEFIQRETGRSC